MTCGRGRPISLPMVDSMKKRKGARRRADSPAEVLAALEAGTIPTANLVEGMALDFRPLMQAVCPSVGADARIAPEVPITRRMAAGGQLILEAEGTPGLARLADHPSDTVRGWVCYGLAALPEVDLAARLTAFRPLANDPHFAVREWAWIALRPHLAAELDRAVTLLTPWTGETSPHLRRFAAEALRPRGVWCAHIEALKAEPAPGLPLLEPLKADPARYVQDSVANWLNDAAKTRPDWTLEVTQRWASESDVPATRYIIRRARRSLGEAR